MSDYMPVRSAPQMHTDDIKVAQKPSIESREDLADEITVAPEVLQKEYAAALAFNEQPVTIRIEPSSEKFAPKVVDCWCNGRGAEILINGKWVPTGALPVGRVVTTKRKYVEILARSKTDSIQTRHDNSDAERPHNYIDRFTSSRAPFSVIEDKDPRGAEWLTNLVQFG